MDNLKLKIKLSTKFLFSLHEILSEPYSPIIRYATLFRFRRSVEIFWRLVKDYLFVHEGFVYESPKSCMRIAFKVGLMNEEETVQALEMIDEKEEIRHVAELTLRKLQKKSTGRSKITGNLWTRFAGGQF